jgi:hypothetical protein
MTIKKGLIGLLGSLTLVCAGIYGCVYSGKNLENNRERENYYLLQLELNDEKIKRGSEDLIPPEKVYEYRKNLKNLHLRIEGNALLLTASTLFGLLVGSVGTYFSTNHLIKELKSKYKNPTTTTNTDSSLEEITEDSSISEKPKESYKPINLWIDIDKIEEVMR